jgi:hypothetical protein
MELTVLPKILMKPAPDKMLVNIKKKQRLSCISSKLSPVSPQKLGSRLTGQGRDPVPRGHNTIRATGDDFGN